MTLKTKLKFTYGWITWFFSLLLSKVLLTLVGLVVVTPFIIYSVYRGANTLPKLLWLWDNAEAGYRNNGLGDPHHLTTGDGKERQDYLDKGYNEYQIALHWSLIRNPVNNLQLTFLASDLRNYDEIVYSETSIKPYHGKRLKNGSKIKEICSPFPWRIRDIISATDHGNRYWDLELIRKGWLYYPMYRSITINPEEDENKHDEFIIGYKNYRYKTFFVSTNQLSNPDIANDHLRQSPTINWNRNRSDTDWA